MAPLQEIQSQQQAAYFQRSQSHSPTTVLVDWSTKLQHCAHCSQPTIFRHHCDKRPSMTSIDRHCCPMSSAQCPRQVQRVFGPHTNFGEITKKASHLRRFCIDMKVYSKKFKEIPVCGRNILKVRRGDVPHFFFFFFFFEKRAHASTLSRAKAHYLHHTTRTMHTHE